MKNKLTSFLIIGLLLFTKNLQAQNNGAANVAAVATGLMAIGVGIMAIEICKKEQN